MEIYFDVTAPLVAIFLPPSSLSNLFLPILVLFFLMLGREYSSLQCVSISDL